MIYLFTYDLRPSFLRNVEPLRRELESTTSWCHYFERTWLIGTHDTLETLARRISRHLKPGDYWLLIRVTREYKGMLPKEAWDWIEDAARVFGI